MRLIGTFDTEKEAYTLYSFLLKEGIPNVYEPFEDPDQHKKRYRIWVTEEEDLDSAVEWLNKFQENPQSSAFQQVQIPLVTSAPPLESKAREEERSSILPPLPARMRNKQFHLVLTQAIIALCAFLFLWNGVQDAELMKEEGILAVELGFTPLQRALIFDYPQSFQCLEELIATHPMKDLKEVHNLKELPPDVQTLIAQAEKIPSWKGIYDFISIGRTQGWKVAQQIPLFEKIRQGEFWRLVTPAFLHANLLHILFNMAWAWILGKQIEERVRRWKIVLLILIIAIISNVAQYLISGPYFLGYSGVVVGLAGFIWMRQKKAPWEGYPLSKATALFLFFFVMAMFALELITFGLQAFSIINLSANVANTAHIVGGLCGLLLGKLTFFARGKP